MPKCKHCHQPQTAAQVICSECYETLTAQLAEKDKLLAAAVERTKKLCYLEYYGRCETDKKPCDGCVEQWRGPQEAGEGGG